MPRPKKPAYLKELNGSAKHDPQRVNNEAPVPKKGIGPAPDIFSEEESLTWDYLVSTVPAGVLGDSDRPTFELMTKLFHRFRYGTWDKEAVIPQLTGAELGRLDSIMGRYGMTPSDRQKIIVKKGEKKNGFEGM